MFSAGLLQIFPGCCILPVENIQNRSMQKGIAMSEESSSRKKLKVGVIGTGVLGRYHTRLYKANDKVDLLGVFDVNFEAAQKVADEFGVKAYENMDELVDLCDALTVAVPATYHHKSVMPLIAKGKHVLVEKPIASTVKDAVEMVEAAEKQGIVFGVGHVERFNPAMDYLEQHKAKTLFIEAHRLCKYPPPRPGTYPRGTEVSVVLDLMIHDLDLVLTMVGEEVESFEAIGMPVLSKTEDIANVRLKFVNGAVANITASRISAEPMRKFRVFQTDSYLSMDYAKNDGTLYHRGSQEIGKQDLNLDEKNALADEIDNFVEAVIQSRETGILHQPKVSGRQGLRALELAVQICQKIEAYNRKYELYRSIC